MDTEPSWWVYCRKAVAALAAMVAVAAPVLVAALADGHISGVEWVYVVAAVAGLFVVPGAVYAAPRNEHRDATHVASSPAVLDPHGPSDRARRPDWWTEPQ